MRLNTDFEDALQDTAQEEASSETVETTNHRRIPFDLARTAGGAPPIPEDAEALEVLANIDFWGVAQHGRGQMGRRWEYDGSIAMLSCSENVIWNVLQTPASIGVELLHVSVNLQGHNVRAIKEHPIE